MDVPAGKIIQRNGKSVYRKFEGGSEFIYRKTFSLAITARALEAVDYVEIILPDYKPPVILRATKNEIKKNNDVKTWQNEIHYYYPCSKWTVIQGDKRWWARFDTRK